MHVALRAISLPNKIFSLGRSLDYRAAFRIRLVELIKNSKTDRKTCKESDAHYSGFPFWGISGEAAAIGMGKHCCAPPPSQHFLAPPPQSGWETTAIRGVNEQRICGGTTFWSNPGPLTAMLSHSDCSADAYSKNRVLSV